MPQLTLSYNAEDEHHAEITAYAESGSFTGKSSAWFSTEQLWTFGKALGTFPIVPGEEPTLAGGYWTSDDKLDQTHIFVRIEAAGPRGELRLRAVLATPAFPVGKSNQHSVQVAFNLHYSDLNAFQIDFAALLNGAADKATLKAAPI